MFDWEDLEVSYGRLSKLESFHDLIYKRPRLWPPIQRFQNMVQLRRDYHKNTVAVDPIYALRLITLTRDSVATVPKDKIFGLSALLSTDEASQLGGYGQTTEEVYTRFASSLVERGAAYHLLIVAGLQRRQLVSPVLPSWVPDWTALGLDKGPKPITTMRKLSYSAGGRVQGKYRLAAHSAAGKAALILTGLALGRLAVVHDRIVGNESKGFLKSPER
jgi:hypothetical protein